MSSFVCVACLIGRRNNSALHHIGRIMREAGYASVRRGNRRGYIVVRLDSERIEAARRMAGRE
ncbi:MAG: hypothetical protein IKJ42_06115 [Bacteroidaceae bacterium]|nr:hypothetical protein [Bacteroidaceae bacterium]